MKCYTDNEFQPEQVDKPRLGQEMAAFTSEQKRYMVRALARFNSLSEVVRMVKAEYGVNTYRQAVQQYDPTTEAGHALSAPLKKLFFETRQAFLDSPEAQPFSHKAVRLERINALYEEGQDKCNPKLKAKALDLAIKETKPVPLDMSGQGQPGDDTLWNDLIASHIARQRGSA